MPQHFRVTLNTEAVTAKGVQATLTHEDPNPYRKDAVVEVVEVQPDDSTAPTSILLWRVKHKGVTIAALSDMPTQQQVHALCDGDSLTDITIHFETEAI